MDEGDCFTENDLEKAEFLQTINDFMEGKIVLTAYCPEHDDHWYAAKAKRLNEGCLICNATEREKENNRIEINFEPEKLAKELASISLRQGHEYPHDKQFPQMRREAATRLMILTYKDRSDALEKAAGVWNNLDKMPDHPSKIYENMPNNMYPYHKDFDFENYR